MTFASWSSWQERLYMNTLGFALLVTPYFMATLLFVERQRLKVLELIPEQRQHSCHDYCAKITMWASQSVEPTVSQSDRMNHSVRCFTPGSSVMFHFGKYLVKQCLCADLVILFVLRSACKMAVMGHRGQSLLIRWLNVPGTLQWQEVTALHTCP